jgi:3-dehydroquinate dehydratase-2
LSRVLGPERPEPGRWADREPEVYGTLDLSALRVMLTEEAGDGVEVDLRQTDDEAELIGWLHEAVDGASPVILNPRRSPTTATRLRDAAALVTEVWAPLIEVHISNPHAREEFRHTSVISGRRDRCHRRAGVRFLRARPHAIGRLPGKG